MHANYIKLTAHMMETLPTEKQVEVYDFVKFLKNKTKTQIKTNKKTTSIFDLFGLGESGCSDVSINHDSYLYD